MLFPELKDKDLKRAFREFQSIQNKILIDYKKLKVALFSEKGKAEASKDGML